MMPLIAGVMQFKMIRPMPPDLRQAAFFLFLPPLVRPITLWMPLIPDIVSFCSRLNLGTLPKSLPKLQLKQICFTTHHAIKFKDNAIFAAIPFTGIHLWNPTGGISQVNLSVVSQVNGMIFRT